MQLYGENIFFISLAVILVPAFILGYCEKPLKHYGMAATVFFVVMTMKDKPTCFVFHPHKVDLLGNDNVYKIKPFYFPKFSLQKIKFKDIEIQVPDNTAAHLEYSYGPNFMVPDPNFKSIHTEFLTDQFARVKKYN